MTDSVPVSWKRNIIDDKGSSINLCILKKKKDKKKVKSM